jgi:hypothetical protein
MKPRQIPDSLAALGFRVMLEACLRHDGCNVGGASNAEVAVHELGVRRELGGGALEHGLALD